MDSTWLFLGLLLLMLFGIIALQAIALKLGLRWTKIAELSFPGALFTAILFSVAAIAASIAIDIVSATLQRGPADPIITGLLLLIGLAAPAILIVMLFGANFGRSLLASLPYQAICIIGSLVALFVIRPYLYEAFYIPTNAMAPTLLGEHIEAACPNCGAPAFGTLPELPHDQLPSGIVMICSKERVAVFVTQPAQQHRGGGDRILISKLLKPRRWDVIAFKLPSDPKVNYVKRLVALPGEELVIRDGAIWINGEKQDPPPELAGLQYLDAILEAPEPSWTANSQPVKLGPGEYFVLGDFSAQSADSRYWQTGAPGHPSYAVPEENILGVVINIYWPIRRWRAFR
jgi:signal peptidase I